MRDVTRWLERQAARDRRVVFLEDALLGNRFWAYGFWRLRFFFARYAASSAVHAVTVLLLYRGFSEREFVVVLVAFAAASFLGSFWWGALEVMRADVRERHRAGQPHRIPREIGRWLSFSTQLALVLLVAVTAWTAVRATRGGLGAVDVYLLAIAVRAAVELVTRCYHSGIYAIRRIYRPLPALLAVEAVGLAGVLVLWPWLGTWAFPLATVASTLVVAVLTVVYTGRTYRFYGFEPFSHLDLRTFRFPARGSASELLAGGASYALMSLDAILIVAMLGTAGRPLDELALFGLFVLVSPTIRAGFEWAVLLYFDLKRLEVGLFRNLRRRLNRFAVRLSVVLGIVFWGAACLVGSLVAGGWIGWLAALLLPFFVLRSVLAALQIEAFAERAYGELLKNAAFCAAGYMAVGALAARDETVLAGLAVVTAAALLLLHARGATLADELRARDVAWLAEWLPQTRDVEGPVRIGAARLWRRGDETSRDPTRNWTEGGRFLVRSTAEQIARRLGRDGAVTVIAPDLIAWRERGGTQRVTEPWLLSRYAGLLEPLGDTGVQGDGAGAVAEAVRLGLLGRDVEAAWAARNGPVDAADVRAAFHRRFPRGVAYATDETVPETLAELSSQDRRILLLDAAVFARDFRPSTRRSRFDVTAFCERGELRTIFYVDRRLDRRSRARWRATVKQLNLRAALGPLDDEATAPPAR